MVNMVVLMKLHFQRTYLEYAGPFELPKQELSIDGKDEIMNKIEMKG